MINANITHILVLYTISYGSLIIPKIHFHIQYFTISNQFNYTHKFSSVLQFNSILKINSFMQINSITPINTVMPLTNLTYVFDIQDIRVIDTVPLGCRPVSHGFITQYGPAGLLTDYKHFITQYGPAGLLTDYKQSNSEHYRYGSAGLLIGVTHQYNCSQYCYLTLLVYQSILNTN